MHKSYKKVITGIILKYIHKYWFQANFSETWPKWIENEFKYDNLSFLYIICFAEFDRQNLVFRRWWYAWKRFKNAIKMGS